MISIVQKLAKRLKRFTLEEIALIAELDEAEIEPFLEELIEKNLIIKTDNNYMYNNIQKEIKLKNRLPKMFEYHSQETIDMIIKCFCAEIEVDKVIKILNPEKQCVNNFFRYFRERIYKHKLDELHSYFSKTPYRAKERIYMGKKSYLYLYNQKLFVAEKYLKHPDMKNYSNEQRLEIKNIYLRSYRKVFSIAYKKYFHLHLTEEIWRYKKDFSQLEYELKSILFS